MWKVEGRRKIVAAAFTTNRTMHIIVFDGDQSKKS
jgi:hypothetical protein